MVRSQDAQVDRRGRNRSVPAPCGNSARRLPDEETPRTTYESFDPILSGRICPLARVSFLSSLYPPLYWVRWYLSLGSSTADDRTDRVALSRCYGFRRRSSLRPSFTRWNFVRVVATRLRAYCCDAAPGWPINMGIRPAINVTLIKNLYGVPSYSSSLKTNMTTLI